MKKLLFVFAALCAFAVTAAADVAPKGIYILDSDITHPPKPAIPPEVARELADTKAALATAQNAQQSSAIAAEYYKALSEKNDALLRLMQAQAQVADLQSQLAAARSEIADLKAPPKKPAPSPAK